MHKTFPFGYRTEEISVEHDTKQALQEAFEQFGMVAPDPEGNRSMFLQVLDLARLFRAAYRVKYRLSRHPECTRRIMKDVREYLEAGELPYYLKRVWFTRKLGEECVQAHMTVGRRRHERFKLK